MTPLKQLAEHDQSVWIDFLSRRFVKDGDLKGLVDQGVVGVTSNPTIFQGAIAEGDAYDEQIRELSSELRGSEGDLLAARQGRHPRRLRHPALRLRRGRRQGRLGLARGRPGPRARHRQDEVRGHPPARARRPPQPLHQDPGHGRGPAGDRGHDRGRHPGQRDADLLARAPPRGRRGLRPRRPALRRRRRRPVRQAGVRRLLLRLARRHRGRQAPGRDRRSRRAQGQARDRQRQARLPELPGGLLLAASGRRWRPRARPSSAACGPRPATKNKAYKDTVYVEELVGPDTVNTMPRELVEAVADHGEIRGDTLLEDVDEASRILDRFESAGVKYDDVVADARARGRGEVLQVLRGADRGPRDEAEAGRRMSLAPTSGASSGSSCGWTPSARRPPPAPAIRPPRCPPPT